ncbi:MAG TPA: hypothetical protein VHM91_25830 [Verrucomicrobiales bacterium]|jgi:hypothetical protein|nr:hypothetical protein [Verrucomicrobiales bacterium]
MDAFTVIPFSPVLAGSLLIGLREWVCIGLFLSVSLTPVFIDRHLVKRGSLLLPRFRNIVNITVALLATFIAVVLLTVFFKNP